MEADPGKQPGFNSQHCEMLRRLAAATPDLAILRRRLLAWYDAHRRDLPWRRSTDPYRIWLAEIMLQQTRVAAVLEHYRAFLARFPSIMELAAAPLNRVLAAWSGLGYYRRARSLHQAARQMVDRHHGRLPRTLPELRALSGIGRYTSAAVASIAFGVPVAVVDGNVERVISRLLAIHSGGRSSPQTPIRHLPSIDYWALAEALLERRRPGAWNQAMMELGATVCLPRQPRCASCPLKRCCLSHTGGQAGLAPATPARRQKRLESYLLAARRRSVYLVRRASRAEVMAGMWELPRLPAPPPRPPLFRLKHSITVTDYEVAVFDDAAGSGVASLHGGRWVTLARVLELPLTGLARKVLRRARLI